jgi:hypothetical protein
MSERAVHIRNVRKEFESGGALNLDSIKFCPISGHERES